MIIIHTVNDQAAPGAGPGARLCTAGPGLGSGSDSGGQRPGTGAGAGTFTFTGTGRCTPPPAVYPKFPHPGRAAEAGRTPGRQGGVERTPPPTPAVLGRTGGAAPRPRPQSKAVTARPPAAPAPAPSPPAG